MQEKVKVGGIRGWLWFGLMLVLANVVQIPLIYIKGGARWHQLMWAALYLLGFVVAIAIGFYGYHRVHKGWQRLDRNDWWLMVKGYGFIIVSEVILGVANNVFYGETSTANNDALQQLMGRSSLTLIMLSLTAVLASPFLEELTFRGLLIDGCFSAKWFWLPVIASGIIFSLVHISDNVISWLLYAIMGGTFAYVYKRTGKLQSTIILHGFNNLIAVGAMLSTMFH
ncbi:metal-dependent membrane protease [Levilactobacillus koreensis JCM 16448]|uniref:Metal-dependent membrane protease n=1 Tax=Levilactobacillus koreensis TaxID=637971 RepID=A0AAC8UX15_9LACO|nr:type II CAAX endopeptidase family protein [Levilactobacillus koreensis]AKP65462.1 metal-dependent membrane protease [Levilactobacillus koreensis]KRK90214.1 metal-dependent membrane protease [Levilactobacillus koreensis JCM 16448]